MLAEKCNIVPHWWLCSQSYERSIKLLNPGSLKNNNLKHFWRHVCIISAHRRILSCPPYLHLFRAARIPLLHSASLPVCWSFMFMFKSAILSCSETVQTFFLFLVGLCIFPSHIFYCKYVAHKQYIKDSTNFVVIRHSPILLPKWTQSGH